MQKISKISLVQWCSAKHFCQVVDLLTLRITSVFLMKALLCEKVSLIGRRVGGGLLKKVLLGSELVLLGLLTEAGRLWRVFLWIIGEELEGQVDWLSPQLRTCNITMVTFCKTWKCCKNCNGSFPTVPKFDQLMIYTLNVAGVLGSTKFRNDKVRSILNTVVEIKVNFFIDTWQHTVKYRSICYRRNSLRANVGN